MGDVKNYLYNAGDVVNCTKTSWTILGRKIIVGGNERQKYSHKEYLCKCHQCKSSVWKTENELAQGVKGKQGQGNCGVCFNRIVITGKNDVATTHPDIVKYFRDPEDSLHINSGSREKRWFKCPNCGYEFERCVEYVTSKGRLSCLRCDDGISYPNKLAMSVLTQLRAEQLTPEYHPDWSKNYRYDFSFYNNNNHYLLEMDGGFHYEERFGRKHDKINYVDEEKDRLAMSNGCFLIRIECKKSEINYIRKNIEDSILSDLFDLSLIDWSKVESDCCKSVVVEVNRYYLSHPQCTLQDIADIFCLSVSTVRTYLKRGATIGINNYETMLDVMNKNYGIVVDYKLKNPEASNKDIEVATNIDHNTVRNYLIKAKKEGLIDEIDASKIRKDRIREYVKNNYEKPNCQLAKELHCCVDYIRQRRRELCIA